VTQQHPWNVRCASDALFQAQPFTMHCCHARILILVKLAAGRGWFDAGRFSSLSQYARTAAIF
jgi:hypothetical protein